jgi:hypothetical protein
MLKTSHIATMVAIAGCLAIGMTVSASGAAAPTSSHPVAASRPNNITPVSLPIPSESNYVSVADCRIVDTRVGPGALGTHARQFKVEGTGSLASQGGSATGCGVPGGASAISATVIAIDESGTGTLRATAVGTALPVTPILLFHGDAVSTAATLPLGGTAGAANLTLKAFGAHTHVLVDVTGYYVPQIHDIILAGGTVFWGTGHVVSATHTTTGIYHLTFDRDLTGCAVLTTNNGNQDVLVSNDYSTDNLTVDT